VTEPTESAGPARPTWEDDQELDPTRVVIRDKRRIDPTSGALRPEAAKAASAGAGLGPNAPGTPDAGGVVAGLQTQLAERTADLQRLQAEYANYRKRVERDRLAVAEQALGSVLSGLLPVLDDIGRARAHGELEGGFKSVADALDATLTKLGLQRFGEPGDPFDPTVHEAITHGYSAEVDTATCVQIMHPGYRVNGRILRAALVGVAEPAPAEAAEPAPDAVSESAPLDQPADVT
jgi:molecular chaperone GrpE